MVQWKHEIGILNLQSIFSRTLRTPLFPVQSRQVQVSTQSALNVALAHSGLKFVEIYPVLVSLLEVGFSLLIMN